MQSPTIRMSFLLQIAIRKGFAGILRSLISYGGDGGIRTHDLLNANQALSQLSYAPSNSIIIPYNQNWMEAETILAFFCLMNLLLSVVFILMVVFFA
jgi:hypothetical protein